MRTLRQGKGAAIAFCVLAMITALWWLDRSVRSPAGPDRKVTVSIPKGSSTVRIARLLADSGVIRSQCGFVLLARVARKSQNLRPGAYELSPAMTPSRILSKIASGDVSARWVTLPEGFNVWQIAQRLQAEGLADRDRFYALAKTGGWAFRTSFEHPGDSLEGYLFPDTYLIPIGGSEEAIIRTMLDTFGERIAPLLSDVPRSGMSLHEVVTMASLIEREARIPKDRPLISAVLRNRLSRGMRLECDATVLYALGRHKNRVLFRDLEVPSPYNTYIHAGLPPGPIANPGLASIKAALNPAPVGYLYYVARGDGSHIFTRSLEEHERAKQAARGGGGAR